MRQFTYLAMAVTAALGYSGSAAGMAAPSEVVVVNDPLAVDVTNDPLAVEVTNTAPACETLRWQLVGFTAATVIGTAGSLEFTRMCDAEFAGSRWCTSAELLASTNLPATSGEAGQSSGRPRTRALRRHRHRAPHPACRGRPR